MSCNWRRRIAATTARSLVLFCGTPHMTSRIITNLHSLRPPVAVTFRVDFIHITDKISHSNVADAVLIQTVTVQDPCSHFYSEIPNFV